MTVCIAAQCDERFVVVAADRMLTVGQRRYEPQQGKFQFNTDLRGIAIHYAGNAWNQSTAMARFERLVAERTKDEPPTLWTVEAVAQEYQRCLLRVWEDAAEGTVLAKHGLKWDDWRRQSKDIHPAVIEKVDRRLRTFDIGVQVIVSGVNPNGVPSIWFASCEAALSCDSIGFVAIGSGAEFATARLMDASQSRFESLADTLVAVYSAKKAAEADAGVGAATDMQILAHSVRPVQDLPSPEGRSNKLLPGVWRVTDPVKAMLARGYQETQDAMKGAQKKSAEEVQVALAQFFIWQKEDESPEAPEDE